MLCPPMSEAAKLIRIPSLKTVAEFRGHVASLGIDLPWKMPCHGTPRRWPSLAGRAINGKRSATVCVQPMEGWYATVTGGVTPEVLRRWQRFGQSGAKLIFGGEAMAVRPDGRANPNQLIINARNQSDLAKLREALIRAHQELYGRSEDLVIGFQLTHSGRFCKPNDHSRLEPRVACRHPLLDASFKVTSDAQVWTDSELDQLVEDYAAAARIAGNVGADFVDIKHCHGYLLHELLGAFTRPGKYGGSFENRTRMLRDIVAAIRAGGNRIELAVRLSAFDFVPFRPDPALSRPGRPGPVVPVPFSHCLPYRYAFGVNPQNPITYDLTETFQFLDLCASLGVKIINLTAGSPYYNPHIQRPAAYPPSDGYQPPEDPLVGVARQINVVRQLKARAPQSLLLVGTAYSYLQEYLPHVAQYVLRHDWADLIGIGRMVLSYPTILADAIGRGTLQSKAICRTFSDCTTGPRNGLISGCYPLDRYYAVRPEAQKLKEIKKASEQAA